MREVISSYMEELSDDDVTQNQESNIGLVIDGEVCQHLSYQQQQLFYGPLSGTTQVS